MKSYRKHFFYNVLPRVIVVFFVLFILILVTKQSQNEPKYSVTNVLTWIFE